jgi:polyferredoxin
VTEGTRPAVAPLPRPIPWRVGERAGAPSPRASAEVPVRRRIRVLVWARRAIQAGCLVLFLVLLAQTTFRGEFAASADTPVRLPWPVEAFLLVDPFVAAMTVLATHTLYLGLAWSLVVVALTVVFGRVFCGWICPFGTLHHLFGWLLPSRALKGGKRVEANRSRWWQRGKYYLLWAALGAALFGSAIGGLFDPICVAVRCIGLGVLPALQWVGVGAARAVADTNVPALQSASDAAQDALASAVWSADQAHFHQTWLILVAFVAVVFMNRIVPRFWCRALCPLGAFLGTLSRYSLFGLEKAHEKCTDCNKCLVHCQGADSPEGGVKHRQDECHVCFNCEAACPEGVIRFRWFPDRRGTRTAPDLDRRTVIAAAAGGVAVVPALRIANWPDAAYSEKVIRPPGAVEEHEFLERCIRCAECMKVCPNNALHPAFFEAGVEGLWTPMLVPRIGYCEHSCVLCGQVCPTGAIRKIDERAKLGIGQPPIRIGTAMYDTGRCLPWAMATPCIVCEEFCPTSPKAIWLEPVEVPKRLGEHGPNGEPPPMTTVKLQRPHVDPALCIGCGACEKVCPVVDKPAVYVTNAGESRSRTNVILLEDSRYTS